MKNNIKACIFDLDGTIIDSGDMIFKSIEYALAPWNVEIRSEDIEIIRARIPSELFSGFLRTPEEEQEALRRLTEFSNKNTEQIIFYDGMPLLLENLCKQYKLAVWTGRDTESATKILKRNNLDKYFQIIIGCTTLTNNKPHPEGMEIISRALNVIPQEIMLIGDHAHDIEGAKRFGCRSIHVTWSQHLIRLTENDPCPDFVINTVDELGKWFGVTSY